MLFRGGAEGEIRKRLLDKNHIDAVIGLPDKLFTNTGIPVTVIILKKNRALNEPVLMIDASKSFVKEGKQHVLQEKDIAKIVDTYIERTNEKGYSHKASQKEIKENEYNLNIPRYIEAIDEEIAQDVDAHLYGGIPLHQIEQLTVLHNMTKDVLYDALQEVRPGYVELTASIDTLTEDVLADKTVQKQTQALKEALHIYMNTYWEKLKTVHDVNDIEPLKDEMLTEIKQLLKQFKHVSTYAGYQIIAELWEDMLAEDTEKIAISDFYTVGRTREANMVIKGSGKTKRTEQDGWIGAIVPNELILKELYAEELAEVEGKEESLTSITDEINELVEAAKVEESDEEATLGDALNAREDDFTLTAVKAEMKNVAIESSEYELLNQVKKLLEEKSVLTKDIKAKEKALNEQVEDKIENLTDDEIDQLMYQKWFGDLTNNITQLIEIPLKNELDTLKELQARYAATLETIEKEGQSLEAQFEKMLSELVVTE
ncbi:N-6 DNA methylase [Salimicrobium jeotgali]|uniref:N-6 DNA methylase n=1 Tax=Salimicrobium jeotgali TaxID=1230341 RepID=UPI0003142BAF|nr:N-6 DNA methylase [Salimicrobium jeotgali]MBM7696672.1 type I restriction-modification system DNA methylase subunit [Salimicrobium jeotgali]